jgi:hypothetical protein
MQFSKVSATVTNASTFTGVYAEATVMVSGDKQKIISADRMDDELRSIECPSTTELIVELGTQAGYDKAKASWSWITGGDRSFVFIADGDCGGDDGLQPYVINKISFDDSNHKATLNGQIQPWEDWVADGIVHASTQPFDGFVNLPEKRKSGDISFAKDFSGKEIFGVDVGPNNNTRLGLTCADCAITGGVHFDISVGRHGITGYISSKDNLGVRFGLGLKLAGQLTAPQDWKVDILPPTGIPGASFDIKIAKFGFEAAVAAQASLTSVEGELEALFGVAMTIPDQTTFRFDGDSDKFSPNFAQIGPEFSASLSVSAQLTPIVTLGIGAHLLFPKMDFAAGVAVEAPRLSATLGAEVSTQGTCGNPDAIASIGLKVDLDAGISIFGGSGSPAELPNKKEIYTAPAYSIFDKCFPIGGSDQPTPAPPAPPANTCPDGRPMVGDVRYEDNSFARWCSKGSGDVSSIFPGPGGSNTWEVGVDENGPVSSCTLHRKMFSSPDNTVYWCEDPVVEIPKGNV